MKRNDIINEYFIWLSDFVYDRRYEKLLSRLHAIEFVSVMPRDENRAGDGVALRYRFACDVFGDGDVDRYLDGPCSVLEMMVALALRCEETIMDDTAYGNRTGQWFWGMVVNLGLGAMTDDRFDEYYVDDVIDAFLNREYQYDGRGGLFTIRHSAVDMRDVEIWSQMCWYLDTIA